jgi:subtilase family serine protease
MLQRRILGSFVVISSLLVASCLAPGASDDEIADTTAALSQDPTLAKIQARPPHRVHSNAANGPTGLSPAAVRSAYNLPNTGGTGTIAIIDAYDDPTAESDLNVFSKKYGLPTCTTANGCFEKYRMTTKLRSDAGWALEASLDVQWAHAIAPSAKILLVEAKSTAIGDLLAAVNYARTRSDVVAISMSWCSDEFSTEAKYDTYFTSTHGVAFFAASGDDGTGTCWPAASPNVIAVGGTTLTFNADGTLASETAWSGSGGGISAFQPKPAFQTTYGIAGTKRAIPDVSYNADPASGMSVFDSTPMQNKSGWFKVGGTSAGAPQWAAIQALSLTASNSNFYEDAADPAASTYFRDITVGANGSCGSACSAAKGYDTVTGLGSPLTTTF